MQYLPDRIALSYLPTTRVFYKLHRLLPSDHPRVLQAAPLNAYLSSRVILQGVLPCYLPSTALLLGAPPIIVYPRYSSLPAAIPFLPPRLI